MKVIAFDRDNTVDVSGGPIPLSWVKGLAKQHEVWAFGNQRLRNEANIPGEVEMCDRLLDRSRIAKPDRLDVLRDELFPSADEYIVVDDGDYGSVPGWTYYTPEEFHETDPFACRGMASEKP